MSQRELLSTAGMPIRQRGTLFGLTRVAIPVLKKAMATQAEGLPDHIALLQYARSGFVIPELITPKVTPGTPCLALTETPERRCEIADESVRERERESS
ncbi:hypothetical protein NQZ68_014030 [Dissostichus eleginoides]|nr:hypothetical protein NQZ68_014026 [Dissostichus eleginoides]KAI9543099.1 hypothetical protein NQZ68_014030 [Dissostichus eleginoides]